MKKFVLALLCVAGLTVPLFAQTSTDLTGSWQGTLHAEKDLRIIVKVEKEADGKLKANMYSIDQTPRPFPPSAFTFQGGEMKFLIPMIDGSYQGKLTPDGKAVNGTWTQGGKPLDLNLEHAAKETAWEIPAPPPPPKLMPETADPSFDVATIKPNDTGATSMQSLFVNGGAFGTRASSVIDLICFAWDVQAKQIIGAPDWAEKDRYDISAKPDTEGAPNPVQLKSMIKKLVNDRFQLKFHKDKKEMSAFVLRVAKTGPKLDKSTMQGPLPGIGFRPAPEGLSIPFRNITMFEAATFFQSMVLDRPVVDQTELKGRFDFVVKFTPDESMFNGRPPAPQQKAEGVEPAPSLYDALQQQLGLKLTPEKTQVDVIAIDHIEKPSAN